VSAFVTYVAVDDALRKVAVPPLVLATDDDRAFAEAAAERRARRIAGRPRRA
jgi:hypothetical protein